MNPFASACLVEERGMLILKPFLHEKSNGQLVLMNKGPLARVLQETVGDAIFNAKDGSTRSVEIKIEERHTGNLFLEVWSNRNLDDRVNHMRLGSNTGWLFKCVADLLFYYFLENDHLYILDLVRLKRWAFVKPGERGTAGRVWDFAEVPQAKRGQMNDTWGRLVPLEVLLEEVRYRLVFPTQFELF